MTWHQTADDYRSIGHVVAICLVSGLLLAANEYVRWTVLAGMSVGIEEVLGQVTYPIANAIAATLLALPSAVLATRWFDRITGRVVGAVLLAVYLVVFTVVDPNALMG